VNLLSNLRIIGKRCLLPTISCEVEHSSDAHPVIRIPSRCNSHSIEQVRSDSLHRTNVCCTRTPRTICNFELDTLTFCQCLKARCLFRCVSAIIWSLGCSEKQKHTSIALKCAKTSLLPSSGVMKPNPLESLHDLTMPLSFMLVLVSWWYVVWKFEKWVGWKLS